jgi:hypothetical protein
LSFSNGSNTNALALFFSNQCGFSVYVCLSQENHYDKNFLPLELKFVNNSESELWLTPIETENQFKVIIKKSEIFLLPTNFGLSIKRK